MGGAEPDASTPSGGADAGSLTGGAGGQAGAGGTPTALPVGGLVTQQCSDCASLNCPDETQACLADPECLEVMDCLSTCFAVGCAGCLLFSGGIPATLTDFSDCVDGACASCPSINSGGN